jgi:hypothetical protein
VRVLPKHHAAATRKKTNHGSEAEDAARPRAGRIRAVT